MIIYMYLAIIVAVSILTGIITTIIERRGFYPKPVKKEKKVKLKQHVEEEAVATPIPVDEPVLTPIPEEDYNIPVLIASYTVDLSNIVNKIQKIEVEDGVEMLEEKSSVQKATGDLV